MYTVFSVLILALLKLESLLQCWLTLYQKKFFVLNGNNSPSLDCLSPWHNILELLLPSQSYHKDNERPRVTSKTLLIQTILWINLNEIRLNCSGITFARPGKWGHLHNNTVLRRELGQKEALSQLLGFKRYTWLWSNGTWKDSEGWRRKLWRRQGRRLIPANLSCPASQHPTHFLSVTHAHETYTHLHLT